MKLCPLLKTLIFKFMNRIVIMILSSFLAIASAAQDKMESIMIRSVQLYQYGNQISFPLIPLGITEGLELHFDDMGNRVKNYYYTYQLCDADWTPSILHSFEYIKGFQNARIT